MSILEMQFKELKQKFPRAYPREIASRLGVSEANILPLTAPGRVTSLGKDYITEFAREYSGVKMRAIVRNDFAVFESMGSFDIKIESTGAWFYSKNASILLKDEGLQAFRVTPEESESHKDTSIQWYNAHGNNLLKVYIQPSQRRNGKEMTDLKMDNFFTRQLHQDLQWVETDDHDEKTARHLINGASKSFSKLYFALRQKGVRAIIAHLPLRVMDARGWFNILDNDFNLHLKEEEIVSIKKAVAIGGNFYQYSNKEGASMEIGEDKWR